MYSMSSKTMPKLTKDKKSLQLNYKGSETVIKKNMHLKLQIVMVMRLSFLYKQVTNLVSYSSAWSIQCHPSIDYGMLHTLKSV